MNAAAIVVFAVSPDMHWQLGAVVAAGSIIGGFTGGWVLPRIDERLLGMVVVAVGAALTIALFWRL
jgi:uncharacterized membrane protein YfcA